MVIAHARILIIDFESIVVHDEYRALTIRAQTSGKIEAACTLQLTRGKQRKEEKKANKREKEAHDDQWMKMQKNGVVTRRAE